MPRGPRIQAQNCIYHVVSRGNNKAKIFKAPDDYYYFLRKLLMNKKRHDFKVLAYAIMPNHFHLLIKPSEKASLSIIMKCLLTSYSMYHNKKYNRVGVLFQNRFKSFICKEDPYLVSLISYIHQNPKRDGLVTDSFDYTYSSLRTYLEKRSDHLVDKQYIIDFLEGSFGQKGTVLIKKLS